jgi:hypothetical protein
MAAKSGEPWWFVCGLVVLAIVVLFVWARRFLGRGVGRWTPTGRRDADPDEVRR